MKKITMIMVAIAAVGCGDKADAGETATETQSPPEVIWVENTETISYHLYRQAWRKANNKPVQLWDIGEATDVDNEDPGVPLEVVEMDLSDLSFKEAFRLQYLGKGEGHTFWWRGTWYTTDLLMGNQEQSSVDGQ